MSKTRIFTFWEPREKIPGYIRACMRTWTRSIPDSEVLVLDFKTIGDWLPKDILSKITCRQLSLPKQTDCYRAFLLQLHGGIWMDADTIVTPAIRESGALDPAGDAEVVSYGRRDGKRGPAKVFGCFINARRPHAALMEAWTSVLPDRVEEFRKYSSSLLRRIVCRGTWRRVRAFNRFLNAIVDPLTRTLDDRQLLLVDDERAGAFPESSLQGNGRSRYDNYRAYYFTPGDPQHGLNLTKGVIFLHNSWTPDAFRRMGEEEFLAADTRLSGILRALV